MMHKNEALINEQIISTLINNQHFHLKDESVDLSDVGIVDPACDLIIS